jgi:hypothetical protein
VFFEKFKNPVGLKVAGAAKVEKRDNSSFQKHHSHETLV